MAGTRIERAHDDDRPHTILVSDLHVPAAGGEVLGAFRRLLAQAARDGARTRVLVLGDLLEALVNERQLCNGRWPDLLAALQATVRAGVSVTVLHGNRDFMLGRRFAVATGCRVVAGGLACTLAGEPVLALHGDELCTNDLPYQRSKRWLRSAPVRLLCRALPRRTADRVAAAARRRSRMSTAQGDRERFRPVADAVAEVFTAGFRTLVFGHVHTPGHGRCGDGEYWVLPAFDETGIYLVHESGSGLRYLAVDGSTEVRYGPLSLGRVAHPRGPA